MLHALLLSLAVVTQAPGYDLMSPVEVSELNVYLDPDYVQVVPATPVVVSQTRVAAVPVRRARARVVRAAVPVVQSVPLQFVGAPTVVQSVPVAPMIQSIPATTVIRSIPAPVASTAVYSSACADGSCALPSASFVPRTFGGFVGASPVMGGCASGTCGLR
jgi:hypothetical protein